MVSYPHGGLNMSVSLPYIYKYIYIYTYTGSKLRTSSLLVPVLSVLVCEIAIVDGQPCLVNSILLTLSSLTWGPGIPTYSEIHY